MYRAGANYAPVDHRPRGRQLIISLDGTSTSSNTDAFERECPQHWQWTAAPRRRSKCHGQLSRRVKSRCVTERSRRRRGRGDACDADADGDGNTESLGQLSIYAQFGSGLTDRDGFGDACDQIGDGDGLRIDGEVANGSGLAKPDTDGDGCRTASIAPPAMIVQDRTTARCRERADQKNTDGNFLNLHTFGKLFDDLAMQPNSDNLGERVRYGCGQ